MNKILLIILSLFFACSMQAQSVLLEGYIYEKGNRGYLDNVMIILKSEEGAINKFYSDAEGFFQTQLTAGKSYEMAFSGVLLEDITMKVLASDEKEKIFLKIEMERKPGYIFDITLAEKRNEFLGQAKGIHNALIEVYNNTSEELIMILEDHPDPGFKLPLVKGNHYTILVRKEGFIAKRLEAYVDIEGCILCFEGLDLVNPAVSDNLSEKNTIGVILANITMEKAFKGQKLEINNLYYDFARWHLRDESRDELDKVLTMMKDNPGFIVELGSHTDSRGSSKSNRILSDKRARSAVSYLINKGLDKKRIVAKGYGEEVIINHCKNNVDCAEEEHQVNRRTELKIIGLSQQADEWMSLDEMKRKEKMEELLEEIQFSGQIKVGEGQVLVASKNTPVDSIQIINDTITSTKDKLAEVFQSEEIGEQEGHEIDEKGKEVVKDVVKEDEQIAITSNDIEKEGIIIPTEQTIEGQVISKEKEPTGNKFSGIKIAIKISHEALPESHDIFQRHDNIYIVKEGTANIYTIGIFKDRAEAEEFLKTSVKLVYPTAFIVEIVDGNLLR
ncbi:MAG: OmpA family protein [Bacteroidia bacterium]|nr:OmpA family protein [Bacteroidia bacterium]